MKSKANLWTVFISTAASLVMFCLANHSFGQAPNYGTNSFMGKAVQEEQHAEDYVPEYGQRGSLNATPTPQTHDITESDGNSDLGPSPNESQSGNTQTVYDKNGGQKEAANAFQTEHRGRINHGKRAERMVVSESSKPVHIEPTKDGSSDASVGTGRFKDSLLDVAIGGEPRTEQAPTSEATPQPRSQRQQQRQGHPAAAKPQPSASPQVVEHRSEKPEQSSGDDSHFGLDLGIGPAQPSPAASPVPQ